MTKRHVKLILHLRNKGWKIKDLADLVGMSYEGTRHICNRRRWPEIETPDEITGEYLFYTFLKNGDFD